MKGIRIHGRGGQGAVVAAELVAVAALEDGLFGQAFPAFGGERRGAPVQAFVRLDSRQIRLRHRVNNPDYLLILDPSLLDMQDVLVGFNLEGLVLINSEKSADEIGWSRSVRVISVPATRIALEILGQPFVNPAMLGAFAASSSEISLGAIQKAFKHRFPGIVGEKNARAVQMGYDWVKEGHGAPVQVSAARGVRQVSQPVAATSTSTYPGGKAVAEPVEPGAEPVEAHLGVPGQSLNPAIMVAPRTSLAYPTGVWRYNRPVVDLAVCNGCGLCVTLCPDGVVFVEGKKALIDYVYCKGCGICAFECPSDAITMVEEG